MNEVPRRFDPSTELIDIIRQVRRRWRMKLALRGVLAVAVLLGWFVVRPMLRRVSDGQVALYLEECEPSLQEAIISAVEAARANASSPHSATLVRRLVESAVEK